MCLCSSSFSATLSTIASTTSKRAKKHYYTALLAGGRLSKRGSSGVWNSDKAQESQQQCVGVWEVSCATSPSRASPIAEPCRGPRQSEQRCFPFPIPVSLLSARLQRTARQRQRTFLPTSPPPMLFLLFSREDGHNFRHSTTTTTTRPSFYLFRPQERKRGGDPAREGGRGGEQEEGTR